MSRESLVCKQEGYIKERCNQTGRVRLQWYCHLVIQKHTLGSSAKPQTLYLNYLSGLSRKEALIGTTVLLILSISVRPSLFGGLLVIITLFV